MATDFRNRIKETRVIRAEELQANPSNWRRHPAAQANALRGLLSEVGIVAPIIAYESERHGGLVLLDGHLRQETGGEWPVTIVDVTDEEADVILATFDPITGLAEMDTQALAELLGRVDMQAIDDDGLGALLEELATTSGANAPDEPVDADPQIDRAEELRQKWGVERGQLWQLGQHRLICGDCTDADVVGRVMDGDAPALIIADPPYGVSIVATNVSVGGGEGPDGMIPFGGKKRQRGYVGGGEAIKASPGLYPIQQQKKGLGSVGGAKPFGSKAVRGSDGAANVVDVGKYAPVIGDETTETALKSSAFYLGEYPDAVHVWWGANYYVEGLGSSPCWLVWNKETTGNFADCELAWVNRDRSAKLFTHQWNGMLRDSERERRWHPTQKPAALAAWVYTLFTKEGDLILDPFAGAGWSILAGEQCQRSVCAIEMSEEYIAIILERFATATGVAPVRVEGA